MFDLQLLYYIGKDVAAMWGLIGCPLIINLQKLGCSCIGCYNLWGEKRFREEGETRLKAENRLENGRKNWEKITGEGKNV